MLVSAILSLVLHLLLVSVIAHVFLADWLARNRREPKELVAISSVIRLEHKTQPAPAHATVAKPAPQRPPVPVQPQPQPRPPQPKPQPQPEQRKTVAMRVTQAPPGRLTPRAGPVHVSARLSSAELQREQLAFSQTIASSRAADDPVAGATNTHVQPGAPKSYHLNLEGTLGKPQPEGILTPEKRWVDGPWVYYYVSYSVVYADGTTETGIVPWPIRFPIAADPFRRGERRMPLPGPLPDFVASDLQQMSPLVKNCYDHRYPYCPIAHE